MARTPKPLRKRKHGYEVSVGTGSYMFQYPRYKSTNRKFQRRAKAEATIYALLISKQIQWAWLYRWRKYGRTERLCWDYDKDSL